MTIDREEAGQKALEFAEKLWKGGDFWEFETSEYERARFARTKLALFRWGFAPNPAPASRSPDPAHTSCGQDQAVSASSSSVPATSRACLARR